MCQLATIKRRAPLPRYRPDLENIPTYSPGRPTAEVAADLGLDRIVELASNECPSSPIPEIQAAIAAALSTIHRYPLTGSEHLVAALSKHLDIGADTVWVGPGSTSILTSIALATSGPGTSVVFGDPSFVVYRLAALLAGAEPIPVPLDTALRLDPEAMAGAVRPDTAVIYYCNPNNPTSTHSSKDDVQRLVDLVPDSVTIVIDEAYAEFVDADDFASAIPLTFDHDNVIVSRTFSKVYGLAGLRIGYAIGDSATIGALRRPQAPFATGALAQIAAIEALKHQDAVASQIELNTIGRAYLTNQLRNLEQETTDSQTNFVLWEPRTEAGPLAGELLAAGLRVRPMGPWIRVTVGTEEENALAISMISGVL